MVSISIFSRFKSKKSQSSCFPLAASAARQAVKQWFSSTPTQTLIQWREACRSEHCRGLLSIDRRGAAFDEAFAREVANHIVEMSKNNPATGEAVPGPIAHIEKA